MRAALAPVAALLVSGCTYSGPGYDLDGQDVRITFLHTADWHSRLIPYEFAVGQTDERLGLTPGQGPFGGGARMGYLLRRERARADRVLHLDSGDCFQGAPIFNFFSGEAEIRALSESGLDVAVIGNHEFDRGGANLARQLSRWATFPALAANYHLDPVQGPPGTTGLDEIAKPFSIFNLKGLRVGVIGMGNLSSMNSIYVAPNRLGITPLNTVESAQFYVDLIRPMVDLVVLVSHLGLTGDQELAENTRGVDIIFGGHLHIVLNPPKTVPDLDGRSVLIVHSGAFMKYLGRLDVVVRQSEEGSNDWEVVSRRYELFPLDASVPDDPLIAEMLEPYELAMDSGPDLDLLVGYAPNIVRRFGSAGADSALGNLVADSIRMRLGVETDFALTNTTGLRADLGPGAIDVETMINVFPFDNSIATMFVSGKEVLQIFDFVARRTARRGCQTQAQVAGVEVTLDCSGREPRCAELGGEPCATEILIGGEPVLPQSSYELATSDYLAGGGSGYRVLERNTTQRNTYIPMRDATIDRIRNGPPCTDDTPCTTDEQCEDATQTCACDARARYDQSAGTCEDTGECTGLSGHCVLRACVDDVAAFHAQRCASALDEETADRCACDARADANAECAILPCIDRGVGASEQGRVHLIAP
ncbi:MAG: bifunctional metallophosphatase/5'-nucleotidase [Deltaproteobacteria bacterium]|nr:bifunctional metallophosphatase/5'-nucleotidase [Deltaproteobacteria bacterium]